MYGEGISRTGELLKIASELDIIQKAGAWYSYNGNKIGQGSENAKKYLVDNPEIFDEIDHKVRVHYGMIEEDEKEISKSTELTQEKSKASQKDDLVLELDETIEIEE